VHIPHAHVKAIVSAVYDKAKDIVDKAGEKLDEAAKWIKEKAAELWKKLLAAYEWLNAMVNVVLSQQTRCIYNAMNTSPLAAHLQQVIVNPKEGIPAMLPQLEKELEKFLELGRTIFSKGGMMESPADLLTADGALNVAEFDKRLLSTFGDFSKIEPTFGCMLPTIRLATGNKEFTEKRQALATHLHKEFTRIVSPIRTMMLNAALDKCMKWFEKHVMENKNIKKISKAVKGMYTKMRSMYEDKLIPFMEKMGDATTYEAQNGEKTNLMLELKTAGTELKSGWELVELAPKVIQALKDFATEKLIAKVLDQFYKLWAAVLEWGGPLIIRAATSILDTVCATGNAAVEWLCSSGLELAKDVFFFTMTELREIAADFVVKVVEWILWQVDKYVLQKLEKKMLDTLNPALTKVQGVIDKVNQTVATAEAKQKEVAGKVADLSVLVPPLLKDFVSELFGRVSERIIDEVSGEEVKNQSQSFEGLVVSFEAVVGLDTSEKMKVEGGAGNTPDCEE